MPLPRVTITLTNGAFAPPVTSDDGVAGLVIATNTAPTGLALATPAKLKALKDAEDLGITAAYDSTNGVDVYKQLSAFFQAGGATLWLMLITHTTSQTNICDIANNNAKKLLDAAGGAIRLLGISRGIPSAVTYTPTITAGLDGDIATALPKAQELATTYAGQFKPVRVILDGRDFSGTVSALTDLTTLAYNRVAVLLGSAESGRKNAAVGMLLGRLSGDPVQRKPSRVKSGKLPLTVGYFTNGADISTISATDQDSVFDKGYIAFRQFSGVAGYFFNGDSTAAPATDDYNSLSRGRVIDKAIFLAYTTYVQEVDDDVPVTSEGKIEPVTIRYYKGIIDTVLTRELVAKGEASSAYSVIDESQVILTTNKLEITLRIVPRAYLREIVVKLGFYNPTV